jgi:TetR/AcrR family transcriptional repressor of lmrAB and yxaGH operons
MANALDPSARERIVQAATRLFRTRGYAASSMRDIVEEAQAPRGSLRHYFPGGKEQLAVEAVAAGAAQVGESIAAAFAHGRGADGAVRLFFNGSADLLEEREFELGCPVATVALERAAFGDEVARTCAAALEGWTEQFAAGLRADGIDARAARRLAAGIVGQYEGALLLSRVQRRGDPLRAAGALVRQLIAAAR